VKDSGRCIVLATSAGKEDIAIYKKNVGMEDLVEEEASGADAKESKPEPDIFVAALKKAKANAEEANALGDTPYDAPAAGALGIRVVGVTCGDGRRGICRMRGASKFTRIRRICFCSLIALSWAPRNDRSRSQADPKSPPSRPLRLARTVWRYRDEGTIEGTFGL
jgi:beta-phosphoglucomutase-like phosphatase (HAD superfamily)